MTAFREPCRQCRFFLWSTASEMGHCKRRAPVDDGSGRAVWPMVHPSDSCGDGAHGFRGRVDGGSVTLGGGKMPVGNDP